MSGGVVDEWDDGVDQRLHVDARGPDPQTRPGPDRAGLAVHDGPAAQPGPADVHADDDRHPAP